MAKEFYDVSYKTYYNYRINPKPFHGQELHPLYIQVTYDRKSIFFKSYYFELFARPKYDFLKTSLSQIEKLESQVIDYLIHLNSERFDLDRLLRQYKVASQDLLDNFDGLFKSWLSGYLKKAGFPGISALLEYAPEEVCGISVWDDLKKIMDPERFEEMEDKAVRAGPYLPVAMFVRHVSPKRPFCFPVHEWVIHENNVAVENFIDERFPFPMFDFFPILRAVKQLFPKGFNV